MVPTDREIIFWGYDMKNELTSLPFLYGAAYYDEYMPYDRIDTDFSLMKEAGMNVIRIAESTWSTWEPRDNCFDFTHLHRMLDHAKKYDLKVIVGTPTYAVPSWLVKKHPDILSITREGHMLYGHRQLTDITNPNYLKYAERMIRRLMSEVSDHPQVIGYQLDNETRSAGAASPETQKLFIKRLKEKYPDINDFNHDFGLDYWSNRVDDWDAFPDVRGTINGSLSAAYKAFLRDVITDFLHWQSDILHEYMRDDQFITHNFDFSWISYSYGIQPEVNQQDCAKCMDIAGTDIYHLAQDDLDGAMISFGGSVGRSLKKAPYLVLETQSQGRVAWLPYPGQLRLMAYSHIANGAASVLYWNWHSIHNAIESYWKGILSHDLTPGYIYNELSSFRHEMMPWEDHLIIREKHSPAAILADNSSLTGIDEFPYMVDDEPGQYNEVLRTIYDTLYKMNIETDIVYKDDDLSRYPLLIVPMLYSASEKTIERLRAYVEGGGYLVMTFRSCFSDENLKIYPDAQPHSLTDVTGMSYSNFTIPKNVSISYTDTRDTAKACEAVNWMELINPTTADIWATYEHPAWKNTAAITHKRYGSGTCVYLGCGLNTEGYRELFKRVLSETNITSSVNEFPLIKKTGINTHGNRVIYMLNYSENEAHFTYEDSPGRLIIDENGAANSLEGSRRISTDDVLTIKPWSLLVAEIM